MADATAPLLTRSRETEWGWIFDLLCSVPKEDRMQLRVPFSVIYRNGAFPPTSCEKCYFSAKDGRITRAGTEKKEKWSTWAPFMSEHSVVSKREKSPVATLRLVQGDRLAVYPLTMAELHEYLSGAKFKAQAADVHSLQQTLPGANSLSLRVEYINTAEADAGFTKPLFNVFRVGASVSGQHAPVVVKSASGKLNDIAISISKILIRRLEGGLLGGHVRVMRLVTDFLVDDSEELWLSNCPSMNAISIPRSSGGVARRAAGLKRGEANREDAGGGERYDQEDDENDPRGSSNAEHGLADKYSMVPDVSSVHFRTVLLAKLSEKLPAIPMKEKKRLSKSAMRRKDESERIDVREELFKYRDLLSVPVEVSASEGKQLAEFESSMRQSFSESTNGIVKSFVAQSSRNSQNYGAQLGWSLPSSKAVSRAGSVVDVEMDPAELTEQVERVVGAPSGKVIGLGSESYVGREESGSEVGELLPIGYNMGSVGGYGHNINNSRALSAPAARKKEAGASGEGRGGGSAPPERSSQVKANGGAAAIDPDIVAKRPGFLLGSVGQAVRAAGGSASGSAGAVALNEDEDDDDVGDLLVGEDEEDEDDFADEVEDAIMGMRTAQATRSASSSRAGMRPGSAHPMPARPQSAASTLGDRPLSGPLAASQQQQQQQASRNSHRRPASSTVPAVSPPKPSWLQTPSSSLGPAPGASRRRPESAALPIARKLLGHDDDGKKPTKARSKSALGLSSDNKKNSESTSKQASLASSSKPSRQADAGQPGLGFVGSRMRSGDPEYHAVDDETTLKYAVLNPIPRGKSPQRVVVLDDWFDTLEDTMGFFSRMIVSHQDLQVLLVKYPGQAGSTCSEKATLNNKFLASCVLSLLRSLDKSNVFSTSSLPFTLLGIGNGANVALTLHTSAPSLSLSSLVLINPFLHVDPRLDMHIRSWISAFGLSATVNLDLFWHLFAPSLLSKRYLERISPPVVMQILPGVGEPSSLDARSQLCQGTLAHEDLRGALRRVGAPVVVIRGTDNPLVSGDHVESLWEALGGGPDEQQLGMGIRECLTKGEGCAVIDVNCGHKALLESRSEVEEALDAILAATRSLSE